MRFADFVIALPFLLFMILLKVSFGIQPGESGIAVMVFSLVILSWPSTARLIRSQVLVLREQNFILAARINGAGLFHILWKHLFPNVLSLILISLSFAIPSVILTEAFLSFIGLGVVPPTPSWGSMCQEGIKTFLFHPHELIFPAFFIGMTVLAFNLLGDGLRDAFDVNTNDLNAE
jgi:oligopeptide transport system permease protein